MVLCENCLKELCDELPNIDAMVLVELSDAIVSANGKSRLDLQETLPRLSKFQIMEATKRLELLGLIKANKVSKTAAYYISDTGLKLIDMLSKK